MPLTPSMKVNAFTNPVIRAAHRSGCGCGLRPAADEHDGDQGAAYRLND